MRNIAFATSIWAFTFVCIVFLGACLIYKFCKIGLRRSSVMWTFAGDAAKACKAPRRLS